MRENEERPQFGRLLFLECKTVQRSTAQKTLYLNNLRCFLSLVKNHAKQAFSIMIACSNRWATAPTEERPLDSGDFVSLPKRLVETALFISHFAFNEVRWGHPCWPSGLLTQATLPLDLPMTGMRKPSVFAMRGQRKSRHRVSICSPFPVVNHYHVIRLWNTIGSVESKYTSSIEIGQRLTRLWNPPHTRLNARIADNTSLARQATQEQRRIALPAGGRSPFLLPRVL
jgi:hypothetical protein